MAEDYTALLLERIEGQLTRQIALALPEEQEQRAPMLAREVVEALPGVQRLLLTDLDATFESDPAAASRRRSCSPIRGCLPFSYTGWPMSCICARFP